MHNVEYLIYFYAFLRQFDDEMSLPSHTCMYLQKINWLSYLHTKAAKMFQKF